MWSLVYKRVSEWASTIPTLVSHARYNLLSASEQPHIIWEYLAEECAEGRVIGPLLLDSYPNVHVSPFGIIPKQIMGKYRLIVDLSSPHDRWGVAGYNVAPYQLPKCMGHTHCGCAVDRA